MLQWNLLWILPLKQLSKYCKKHYASLNIEIKSTNVFYRELIDTIIMYPKLLIAIVNGPAIGIAATILGIFDIVYASDKVPIQ